MIAMWLVNTAVMQSGHCLLMLRYHGYGKGMLVTSSFSYKSERACQEEGIQ